MIASVNQASNPTTPSVAATVLRQHEAAPDQVQGAGRGLGVTLGKAAEIGKNVAHSVAETAKGAALTTAETGTNFALERGKEGLQHWLRMQLGHTLENICNLPIVGSIITQNISQTIFPKYKEINPDTKIDMHAFQHMLKHGKVDEFGDDLIPVFNSYLSQHLSKEEQQKLQEGSNLLMIKAFSKALYAQATEGVNTIRQPGGIKKIGNAIANWIPLVNKLPDVIKPWAGGAIGALVTYKLASFAFRIVKWAIALFAGVTGLKWLSSKFAGGASAPGLPSMPAMPGEESAAEGGGVMGKIMSGVNKAAQMAAQAQGGGGHGAPGGGIGQALAALAGGGGGAH